jgi:hypothetical protein
MTAETPSEPPSLTESLSSEGPAVPNDSSTAPEKESPPGVDADEKEKWVVLSDRDGVTDEMAEETPSKPASLTESLSSEGPAVPNDSSTAPEKEPKPIVFQRSSSSFLRVSDLDINDEKRTTSEEEALPNYHHPAVDPPPGVDADEKEKWIVLSDRDGMHAPIAPAAVTRLAIVGLETSFDTTMWKPDRKTEKLLKKAADPDWVHQTFTPGPIRIKEGTTVYDKDVLVWTGTFKHDFYGGNLPAIRVAGIVNMSPNSLVDLLLDSTRVKEYNKHSLGREDAVVFQDDMQQDGPFGPSITKVTKSTTKPPLMKRHMRFVTLCHAKELEDGSGYMIVNRAVHDTEDGDKGPTNIIKSEVLLGVNLIRKIEGSDNRCIMLNVNHMKSPMVPMMLAKKIGMSAAIGFVNDIRSIC